MGVVSPSTGPCRTPWAHNLWGAWNRPVATLLGARALDPRFRGRGQFGEDGADGMGSRSDRADET